MEQTKGDLKYIKNTIVYGENDIDCRIKAISLSERLDFAGKIEPKFLCNMVKIFKTTMNKRFDLWDMRKYDEISDYVRKLMVSDIDNNR